MTQFEMAMAALSGLSHALTLISKIAQEAKRKGEWTPDEEAAWDKQWEETKKLDVWRTS